MAEEPTRKLAVLLHADIVGSTALVQSNETLAHQRMQDAFRRFSETIASHGGTAHEVRGDALVAEFPSASDAVETALQFQADNAAHLNDLPDDIRPIIRVGIAMGEVVVADDTVTGEAVVLAQRLERLAEPGGVCIQGTAQDTVPKRLPYVFEPLEEQLLKGFSEPVLAFAVKRASAASAEDAGPLRPPEFVSLELPDRPSIAVLPFTNMSRDPEQEYFSDGITEDIITALSRISGLLVVARNSTAVYKSKAVDSKQVGREQGVRYVLEGSVRKAGNRVRVTAQLIDTATGHHQWADRYDQELDDIFAVQDAITKSITVEMRVQLAEGEQVRLWAGGTDSVEAWECVTRGMGLIDRIVRDENLQARRLAEAALDIDPDYVNAWVLLGYTYSMDAFWGWSTSRSESIAQASTLAGRALTVDGTHPESLALLAFCYSLQSEHEKAVRTAEKAVNFAPNHANNTEVLGWVLRSAGQYGKAIERLKRAMRLCPISPPVFLTIMGSCYCLIGQFDCGIRWLEYAVRLEPRAIPQAVWLVHALAESGLEDEAQRVASDVLKLAPDFSSVEWIEKMMFFKDHTWADQVLSNLLRSGLPA